KPRAEPRRCSSRPLIASVGPLLVPGRSKNAKMSSARPAELSQLDEVVWDLRSEGRDDLLHHHSGSGPVGFSIGSDHGLVNLPGRLDRSMLLAAEQAAEALALPLGQ